MQDALTTMLDRTSRSHTDAQETLVMQLTCNLHVALVAAERLGFADTALLIRAASSRGDAEIMQLRYITESE